MKPPSVLVVFVLFSLCRPCLGQDVQSSVVPNPLGGERTSPFPPAETPVETVLPHEEPSPAPPALPGAKEVVPPVEDFKMSQHMLFIIDVSGSMNNGGRLGKALSMLVQLMNQSVDEYYIAVIAFNGTFRRWPGVPEEGVPKGWAIMPSDASRIADQWLAEQKVAGSTNPSVALRAALLDPNTPLSVILITDGEFNEGNPVVETFRQGQAKREANGRPPASLTVIGVGAATEQNALMLELGQEGMGGFYVQE